MASPAFSAAAMACRAAACSASFAPRPLAVYVASGSSTSSLPGFFSSGTMRLRGGWGYGEGMWQSCGPANVRAWHAACVWHRRMQGLGLRTASSHAVTSAIQCCSRPPADELHRIARRRAGQPGCAVCWGGVVPVEQLFQRPAAVNVCRRRAHRRRACAWVGARNMQA